jgi:hypothetical protein
VVFLVDFCRTWVEDGWDNTKSDVKRKEGAVGQRDSFYRLLKLRRQLINLITKSISMVVIKLDCLGRELYQVKFVIEEPLVLSRNSCC